MKTGFIFQNTFLVKEIIILDSFMEFLNLKTHFLNIIYKKYNNNIYII